MSEAEAIVRDRLWRIKSAAIDIRRLCDAGALTCEGCPIIDDGAYIYGMCTHVGHFSRMRIP